MAKTAIKSAQVLSDIAAKYENKQDWHNALETHKKAAAHYERAISNESDTLKRQTLNSLKKTHEEKISAVSVKLNQSSDNVFDMKKLEQEITAIQRGGNIGDPYALVPGTEYEDDEDDGDPFNRFWGVVEPMVNKLSQTSSPPPSSPWQRHEPVLYDTALNEAETNRIQHEMSFVSESFFILPKKLNQDTQSDQNQTPSLHDREDDPEQENKELKSQITDIKNEIQTLQQRSVDSTVLKTSIIQFKNDVHKQALRILQTQESAVMTRSAMAAGSQLSKNIRHVGGTSTAEIVNRIRDLEESNKALRSQNRKQDALMNKYRERWEKLKEGAKRRQPSSTASTVSSAGATSSGKSSTLLSNLASTNPPMTAELSSAKKI